MWQSDQSLARWTCLSCEGEPQFDHDGMVKHAKEVHDITPGTPAQKEFSELLEGIGFLEITREWDCSGVRFRETISSESEPLPRASGMKQSDLNFDRWTCLYCEGEPEFDCDGMVKHAKEVHGIPPRTPGKREPMERFDGLDFYGGTDEWDFGGVRFRETRRSERTPPPRPRGVQVLFGVIRDAVVLAGGFELSFQRTLRIPDDGKAYPLPPDLGRIPLSRIEDFKHRVPGTWVQHGGVFMPMHQCEAMWLSFRPLRWMANAIKIAVGNVNAVSGKVWEQKLCAGEDDYLVSPPQAWLDGVSAGGGYRHQFVPMPLEGGYAREAQLMSKEPFRRIQIFVFEPMPGKFEWAGHRSPEEGGVLHSMSGRLVAEGAEMGLPADGMNKQGIYPDPYGIDMWDEASYCRVDVYVVTSMMYREITGNAPPRNPVSVKTYAQYGLPWLDTYEEEVRGSSAPEVVRKVRIDEELDREKTYASQQDETATDASEDKVVKSRNVADEGLGDREPNPTAPNLDGNVSLQTTPRPPVGSRLRVKGLLYIDDEVVRLWGYFPERMSKSIAVELSAEMLEEIERLELATGDLVQIAMIPAATTGMECVGIEILERSGAPRLDVSRQTTKEAILRSLFPDFPVAYVRMGPELPSFHGSVADEAAVLRACLFSLGLGSRQLASSVTAVPEELERTHTRFLGELEGLLAETVADFLAKNKYPHPVFRDFTMDGRLVCIHHFKWDPIVGDADSWGQVSLAYPHSSGIIRFSRVGLCPDASQALVYAIKLVGPAGGWGNYYLFTRSGNRWWESGNVVVWEED